MIRKLLKTGELSCWLQLKFRTCCYHMPLGKLKLPQLIWHVRLTNPLLHQSMWHTLIGWLKGKITHVSNHIFGINSSAELFSRSQFGESHSISQLSESIPAVQREVVSSRLLQNSSFCHNSITASVKSLGIKENQIKEQYVKIKMARHPSPDIWKKKWKGN